MTGYNKGTSIIDLSYPLDTNIQAYPNEPGFTYQPLATSAKEGYNVRSMTLTSHTGTHIDAPFHFFADGKTIDQISLGDLVGPSLVIDLSDQGLKPRQKITWIDLEPYASKMDIGVMLLVNTGWSKKYWRTDRYYDHPYFSRDAAENIWDRGIRVFGTDTLSPDETAFQGLGGEEGFGFHEVILGRGGIIAENLTNLEALAGKENVIVHLIPLNMAGSDGSPIRAFAY